MNLSKASSFNELVTNIIIEELYRHKIDTYFISPGSRSTPITSSVAYQDRLTKHIHFDERGAAFQVLGYARATSKPAVLICTSGSAGANYYPAICEASADSVPMIILTADRPVELHNVLANQTFNQNHIYSDKVKTFYNLNAPDKNISLKSILEEVNSIIQRTKSNPNGPVHINCMFREPLVSQKIKKDYSKYTNEIKDWLNSDKPFTNFKKNKADLISDSSFDKKTVTILIAGALKSKRESKAVLDFAEENNLPIFADIRSRLRLSNNSQNIISYYDLMACTKLFDNYDRYQIIHVGGNIVSKRLLQFIEKANIKKYVVLHNSIDAYNPHHKLTESYSGDIAKLLKQLSKQLKPFNRKFLTTFIKQNKKIKNRLAGINYNFSEISITRQITQLAKKNSFIYSANSLSVRLLDMFATPNEINIPVISNRGLSGIDGTIASAVGFAIGAKKRGTLLIGDLAFMHDLNSLALVKQSKYPITIIILNNNGGKLFSYLPVVKDKLIYKKYFETPQNVSFKHSATQFELPYYNINSIAQFMIAYKKAQSSKKSSIIEISLFDSQIYKEQKKIEKEIKS